MNLDWASDPLLLTINALATYRLTRVWTRDTLPPLPTIRQNMQDRLGNSPLADLLDCPWCIGFWIALGVTLTASTGPWWLWIAVPLALSTVVGLTAARDD